MYSELEVLCVRIAQLGKELERLEKKLQEIHDIQRGIAENLEPLKNMLSDVMSFNLKNPNDSSRKIIYDMSREIADIKTETFSIEISYLERHIQKYRDEITMYMSAMENYDREGKNLYE